MDFREETLARELHRELRDQFDPRTTEVTISGRGVHWRCDVRRGSVGCDVHCFGALHDVYLTHYSRGADIVATSRTSCRESAIDAADDWLNSGDVTVLHERYPFVDRWRRALGAIRDVVSSQVAALNEAACLEVLDTSGEFCRLVYKSGDRSVELSFRGDNEHPDAGFSWDRTVLFTYQPDDPHQFADVLRRWLCDSAMPSVMRQRFPWLDIGSLADSFEAGKPVEGEFIQSWEGIEGFYRQYGSPFQGAVLSMLSAMRSEGYDKRLRAGQSLMFLGLSRSRRHGLRADQPSIWFRFGNSAMSVNADFAATELCNHPIELTEDVRRLLDALVECKID